MEYREVMIEVLVPGSEAQQEGIGDGVNLTQQVLPEWANFETELGKGGIVRMAPGPGGGYQQDDPEGRLTAQYRGAHLRAIKPSDKNLPEQEDDGQRDRRFLGTNRQ